MMFDGLYEDQAEQALAAKALRPPEPDPNARRFSVWGTLGAAPKGMAAGSAQALASTADLSKGTTENWLGGINSPLGRIPIFSAVQSLAKTGMDVLNPTEGKYTSEVGTSLRNVAQDYTPDAQTTHVAESAVFNLFRVGSKAITAATTMGNIPGAVMAGAEEGFSQSDDLARQGVDIKTRTKVGAVTGVVNTVGFGLPAAGKNWLQTGALALFGGPASFVAQNSATREILKNADYSNLADQYDPFDPVGLALSTVVPLGFGVLAMRGAKAKGGKPAPELQQNQQQARADTAQAATETIAPSADVVDAARVSLVRQQMDAANPVPERIDMADAHVKAYTQAMDQMAAGDRVQVADIAPEQNRITPEQRDANFKAWFGDSKVVDDAGAPMVVYHGTGSNIAEITPSAGTANSDAGFYVSPSAAEAGKYALLSDGSANIVPVFANIRNPYFALTKSEISTGENGQMTVKDWGKLRAAGFDGVAIGITKDEFLSGAKKLSDAHELAVLNGRQIKSAIGNSGKFDPNSASLTDNPIADWGAGLKKALDDLRAEVEKSKPKQAKAPADTAQAATEGITNVQDLPTPARAQIPEDQVGAPAAGNSAPVQANGVNDVSPLESRIAELEARTPQMLDAVMPVEFDDSGKPVTSMTVRDYIDMVKREAEQDAADADLIEVAATCFLTGGL